MTATEEIYPVDPDRIAKDLVRYREGAEVLMQIRSDKPISNGEPAHAAVIFALFFKYAKEHVLIFCQNLSRTVFDDPSLIEEAKRALKRKVRIDVIIQDDNADPSGFFDLLQSREMAILCSPADARSCPFNFAVMDGSAFRVEPDRNKCEAKAVMYFPDFAARLVRSFDYLRRKALVSRRSHPSQPVAGV